MNPKFDILATPIEGLFLLQRRAKEDHRGYFERVYCVQELEPVLAQKSIMQINRTLTLQKGTVRGMHFQYPPYAETKVVTCLRGEVFDVAIDIRADSSTFLHWHGEILSEENHKTLVIPEGVAHGFQTLSDSCELLYFHTAAYHAESEGGVNAEDPALAIKWPMAISAQSSRDKDFPFLPNDFTGVIL